MSFKLRMSLLAGCVLALAATAPAVAAPDRTINLDSTTTSKAWDGKAPATPSLNNSIWYSADDPAGSCHTFPGVGPLSSTDAVDYCDETLVNVTGTGSLDVQLPEAGDGNIDDWDLFVYTADADGTPGDLVGSSDNAGGAEDVSIDGASGSFLVVAVPYQYVTTVYKGSLTFTPDPAT